MNDWTQIRRILENPVALRGIDHLIDRVRRVMDRHKRMPVRQPDPKPLARIA